MENCKNCGEAISKNFCPNCGQKKYKRIDRKYITDELQYSVLHMNGGFMYSVKNLLKNPGKTARDFVEGNRVKHYKPILLAFVLSGISAFISYKIIGLDKIMNKLYEDANQNSPFMNDMMSFMASYNSLIMLALIPLFAVFTRLAFKSWGQNYYEHMVMNAFIVSYYTLIYFVAVYPAMYIFKDNMTIFMVITSLSYLLTLFLSYIFYKGFYPDKSFSEIIARIFLVFIMVGTVYFVIMMAATLVFVLFMGPEATKYVLPNKA